MTPTVHTKLRGGLLESRVIDGPTKVVSATYGPPAFETDEFTKEALMRRKSFPYRTFYRKKAPQIVRYETTRWPSLRGFFVSHVKPGFRSTAVSMRPCS